MSTTSPQLGFPVPTAQITSRRLSDIQAVRQALLVLDGTLDNVIDTMPTRDTTGNAGTADRLKIAREINGVNFDGTQNILIEATDPLAVHWADANVAFGVPRLGADGKISSNQLPSYVDDVLEFATVAAFPATGEVSKIFISMDTNKVYRWSGTQYTDITGSGVEKINGRSGLVVLNKTDVGLGNVDNTADLSKPVSLATMSAIQAAELNAVFLAGNDATTKANAARDASTPASHAGQGTGAHAVATETSHGFMSNTDKAKLNAIVGINTGDQINVSGNAGTATRLQTARLINGVAFDGTQDITVGDTVARIALSEKGAANGVATLDAAGLVPVTQLPSYVDDVLEFATLAAFPASGEVGKIYVAINSNKTYRWSGSTYVQITSGAVDSVAGKTGLVVLVKADVGLGNVDNTSDMNKPVSTAQAAAIQAAVADQLSNLVHPFFLMGSSNV